MPRTLELSNPRTLPGLPIAVELRMIPMWEALVEQPTLRVAPKSVHAEERRDTIRYAALGVPSGGRWCGRRRLPLPLRNLIVGGRADRGCQRGPPAPLARAERPGGGHDHPAGERKAGDPACGDCHAEVEALHLDGPHGRKGIA